MIMFQLSKRIFRTPRFILRISSWVLFRLLYTTLLLVKSTGSVLAIYFPQVCSGDHLILQFVGRVCCTCQGDLISPGLINLGYTATSLHLVFGASDASHPCEVIGLPLCMPSKFQEGWENYGVVHRTFSFYGEVFVEPDSLPPPTKVLWSIWRSCILLHI